MTTWVRKDKERMRRLRVTLARIGEGGGEMREEDEIRKEEILAETGGIERSRTEGEMNGKESQEK